LLREIEVHNLGLPVARSATWDREDVRTLIVNLSDANLPERDEIPIMNLIRSLRELVTYRSAEVHPSPHLTADDRPRPGAARRGESERKIEGKGIVTLPELNSKRQAKNEVLTTEGQILVKGNDKSHVVCQRAVDENAKMKSENQTHLEEAQRLISMNTKLITDQQSC
jgi:hypothetical protein